MFIRRNRIWILAAFALMLGLSLIKLKDLQFSFSLEAFFPDRDSELEYYLEHKAQFRKGNDNLILAFYREEGVFDAEFLQQVDSFAKASKDLKHVREATSLLSLEDYIWDPFLQIVVNTPAFNWKNPDLLPAEKERLLKDSRFLNNFIDTEGKVLGMFVSADSALNKAQNREFYIGVKDLIEHHGLKDAAHIVGYPAFGSEITEAQEFEFGFYVFMASLVILICMIFLFRRFWGIVVAFASVFLGMVLFFGLLAYIGRPLDLMSTIYPILMVIVGTSDVVHIMTKYSEELKKGTHADVALSITFREIGLATFMTSLTTAIGFLSLYFSHLPPIRNFGVMSAVGVLLAYLTVMLFTTAVVSFFKADQLIRPPKKRGTLDRMMVKTYLFTRFRKRSILIGLFVVMVLSGIGISRISRNLHDIRDLPWNIALRDDYKFFDDHLHGINNTELGFKIGEGHSITDLEVLQNLDRFESYVSSKPESGPIYSPLIFFKMINRAWHGNDPDAYRLPERQKVLDNQYRKAKKFLGESLESVVSDDGKTGRIAIKVPDVGSLVLREYRDDLSNWVAQNIDPALIQFRHTGGRYLIDVNQSGLVLSMLKSVGLAFLIVALFMALVFRNLRLIIISLIPNVIPLIAAAGLIGWLGFELDPKVSIMFTISFGIAVDDTIHFLARFRIERLAGASTEEAIKATFNESGKAITITSIILFFGFLILCFSSFPPTFVIGLSISFTLAVALISDLLLMPLCLRWLLGNRPLSKKQQLAVSG